MKLDQIAVYAHDEEQADELKRRFGLFNEPWVEDEVEGVVSVYSSGKENVPLDFNVQSKGKLRFNYSFGIELEILTYLSGPNWLRYCDEFHKGKPFTSHVGFHLEDDEEIPAIILNSLFLAQAMVTHSHTNPFLLQTGRRYDYTIFHTRDLFGFDLKFIKRIRGPNEEKAEVNGDKTVSEAAHPGDRGYYDSLDGTMNSLDVINKFGLNYAEGNIFKYLVRHAKKGSQEEDLTKMAWFVEKLKKGASGGA